MTLPRMGLKGKAFRLNKSLYGLKQSGANWYSTIKTYLQQDCKLLEIPGWSCVLKNDEIIVCLFVDDMVVMPSDLAYNMNLVKKLRKKFDTKVVKSGRLDQDGVAQYDILGLDIEYRYGKDMKMGMEKILEAKLKTLDVPLNKSGKKLKVPSPPNTYITKEDYVATKGYKKNVKTVTTQNWFVLSCLLQIH
ncbi:hypothetical protein KAFR_0K02295 [Kazachstania africana CBS 2517]|uniref:Reverse transcriptase Ty1/copia-type domain-containing protein n=1 Tax=Kazachstania africana (strain ATCC 22294 / BCRC 22015 / CBS 2517 / CECT 1963 / NBRC 1671 / NRRL Y-8276) TaxID=1071382 RepID=H2B1T4_KAZAF|nr:hypothetical protein KAFR_0K02295 [Kazachstania africana CBS 2517]CCF60584.1 hypothetical protein KAFR_0K02295 [Kazachstania africana CBS 2517]